MEKMEIFIYVFVFCFIGFALYLIIGSKLKAKETKEEAFRRKYASTPSYDEASRKRETKLSKQIEIKKLNERVLADKVQVEGAPPYAKIYWVTTRGAKHCPDRLVLAVNSPYTKETLPSYPGDGTTKCGKHCQCKLLIRIHIVKEEAYEWSGPLHPFDKNRQPRPELYGKFKENIPEFRFFLDKNLGDRRTAKKEFEAAVNAAKVGFTGSNYDDPFNRRFFKSNRIWADVQKIKEIEKTVPGMSPEGIKLRKKRQAMMQDLLTTNTKLRKDGLRWIRPDGYGGYTVGPNGRPSKQNTV